MGDEYEVESILGARVVKKTPRSKQLVWKYHVKWKGYEDPEDNTWEPAESFSGSEHFVEDFWKKVDTGGRDVEYLKSFKEGEELIPSEGRESHASKRSRPKEGDKHDLPSARSGKRKRSLGETPETTISNKRANTRTSKNSRKGRHEQSPIESQLDLLVEHQPEQEEEERAFFSKNQSDSEGNVTPTVEKPPRYRKRMNSTPPAESSTQTQSSGVLTEESQPSISSHSPAHRARAANPLFKMMGEDINMEGTISTKVGLFAQRGKQSANVEGHAQLSGGELSTATSACYTPSTGSPDKTVIAFRSEGPPHSTGWSDEVEGPEDYEEDDMKRDTNSSDLRANNGSESIFQQSLSLAKDKLFPSSFTSASQSISSAISAAWRFTIFSPLTSGSYQPHPAVHGNGEDSPSQIFTLNLGVTVSLPVALMPLTSSNSPESELVLPNNSNNPPGKFYSREAALAVLGTLRTGGPCAMVTHGPQCSEAQKDTFRQFSGRLSNDELFLAMAGTDVLAFCSSTSLLIFQRLNFPPLPGSSSGAILVRRVTIQDHSAYATAALQA